MLTHFRAKESFNRSDVKDQTIALNVRLKPSESSGHPRATNNTNVTVAKGIVYLDFGFIEATLLAAIAEDVKGWPGRAERTGRHTRHLRGHGGGCAGPAASADSTSLSKLARCAEAENVSERKVTNGKCSI